MILTNKTVQENKQTKIELNKANNAKYSRTKIHCSVASYDAWPGNEI